MILILSLLVYMTVGDSDPIVNEPKEVLPNNDNSQWFDYKNIMNIFGEYSTIIMAVTGAVMVILVLVCVICKCRKGRKYTGYSKSFVDVEKEAFNGVEYKWIND